LPGFRRFVAAAYISQIQAKNNKDFGDVIQGKPENKQPFKGRQKLRQSETADLVFMLI